MTDFAWLIEAPGQYYLSVDEIPQGCFFFGWSNDHNKALRFFSEKQADDVMMAIREIKPEMFLFARLLRDARPVEHGWMGGPVVEAADTSELLTALIACVEIADNPLARTAACSDRHDQVFDAARAAIAKFAKPVQS